MSSIIECSRKYTSLDQLEKLVEFLETHRDLALNRLRGKDTKAIGDRLWEEFANTVNVMGAHRSAKEWNRVSNINLCCFSRLFYKEIRLKGFPKI